VQNNGFQSRNRKLKKAAVAERWWLEIENDRFGLLDMRRSVEIIQHKICE